MQKYVGAMVLKSFQFALAAEQDHFENKSSGTKKIQQFLPTRVLKKNKTIFMRRLINQHLSFENVSKSLLNSGNGKVRRSAQISGGYSVITAFSLKTSQIEFSLASGGLFRSQSLEDSLKRFQNSNGGLEVVS